MDVPQHGSPLRNEQYDARLAKLRELPWPGSAASWAPHASGHGRRSCRKMKLVPCPPPAERLSQRERPGPDLWEANPMPEQETIERAREDAREGKSPSTQAGEFVREEIHHVREGKHGARSTKQAIAIGLSKARRAGVRLPRKGASARRKTRRARKRARPSARRSRAVRKALKREGRQAASRRALSRQAKAAARRRSSAQRSAAARKASRTKGPRKRSAAARKAARTRARRG